MNDLSPNINHKWNADRPVEHPAQDELGRRGFAQRIAKELCAWRQKDSLVVSLNGDWGSGKTTLANLIRHFIDEQTTATPDKKPIVIQFNPWQWSGQDKLLVAFFDEIGAAFRSGKIVDTVTAKKLARFWEGLKVITIAGGELATRLQEALTALIAMLAGGSGMLAAYMTNPTAKAVLSFTASGLLIIAGVCAIYAPIAEKLADLFKWGAANSKPTLEQIRSKLHKELSALKSPLIIVIDDIDRLTKENRDCLFNW